MVEIGAFFMRTDTELVLKSRRVVPKRLLDAGFTFEFPEWPEAATELIADGGKSGSRPPHRDLHAHDERK
jgi:NAD dependent epimerase/dehydratase family enzyme